MKIKVQTWKCVSEKTVADCKVFKVKLKTFVHPDGRKGNFYINECSDWVQVAPIIHYPDGSIKTVLVNQFRFASNKTSWEFSGGVMDKGESPTQTAIRELAEETGFTGKRAKLIASYSPNPAIQSNLAHFVVIEDCKKTENLNWDENEEIETKIVDVEKLDSMVKRGKIFHSMAINSLYFLQKYLQSKKSK